MLCWCAFPIGTVGCSSTSASESGSALVAAAQHELDTVDQSGWVHYENDGAKYWSWSPFSFDGREPWCACFVSWCADQAGLYEMGLTPHNASVSGWEEFYNDNPPEGTSIHSASSGYTPVAGDICLTSGTHIGIVKSYDADTDTMKTIEGNTGELDGKDGGELRENTKSKSSWTHYIHIDQNGSFSGGMSGCSASSAGTLSGDTMNVPTSIESNLHTYMGWQMIIAKSSNQWKLMRESGALESEEIANGRSQIKSSFFDEEGFGKIDGRYVIACTTTFGDPGDYIDFYLENGEVINAIVGDTKNPADAGCTKWGHQNGRVVIEFVVDYGKWYNPLHTNPGNPSCHPEWNSKVTKAVNGGSYFDGAQASGSSAGSGLVSCSASGPSVNDASSAKAKLDLADLTSKYSKDFSHGEKSIADTKYIVLHDTEMTASPEKTAKSWKNQGKGIAAHFIVGTDGSIVQCVALDKIAHHAGYGDTGNNGKYGTADESRDDKKGTEPIGKKYADYGMNSYSIGIEMVHKGGKGKYTTKQLEALDDLIAYIDAYMGKDLEIIDHKAWRSTNSDTSSEFSDYLANYKTKRTHDGK